MLEKKALTATHLSKSFRLDVQRNISVLEDISLSADYGEFISILGISAIKVSRQFIRTY